MMDTIKELQENKDYIEILNKEYTDLKDIKDSIIKKYYNIGFLEDAYMYLPIAYIV